MNNTKQLVDNSSFKLQILELIENSRHLIESKISIIQNAINGLKEENEIIFEKCIYFI